MLMPSSDGNNYMKYKVETLKSKEDYLPKSMKNIETIQYC